MLARNLIKHTTFISCFSKHIYSQALLNSLNTITPTSRIAIQPFFLSQVMPEPMRQLIPSALRLTSTKADDPAKVAGKYTTMHNEQMKVAHNHSNVDKQLNYEVQLLKEQIEKLDRAIDQNKGQILDSVKKNIEVLEQVKKNQEVLTAFNEQSSKAAEENGKASSLARKIIIAGISIAIIQDIISVADSINDMVMTYNKEWHDTVLEVTKDYLPKKVDLEDTQWDTMEPYVANKTALKQAIGDTARTIILLGIALLAKDLSGVTKASVSSTMSRAMTEIRNAFIRFK